MISLVAADASRRPAAKVQWKDSHTLFATFDLTGLLAGAYDVRIDDQGQSATAPGPFTVATGNPGHVEVRLSSSGAIRVGRQGTVTVDYSNTGETDVAAPLLILSSDNAKFRLAEQTDFVDDAIQLLGINRNGPAGILPPGYHGTISLTFSPKTSGNGVVSNFTLSVIPSPDTPFDWNSVKDDLRPALVRADAWDAIFANFKARVGNTLGQYQAVLADNATYLSRLGEYTVDVNRLLSFELQRADDFGAITQRYTLGALGRCWPDPTAVAAVTDAAGNVTILVSGRVRSFFRQPDASYRGVPGDFAALTLPRGAYRLRETDGTVTAFRPDGKLDYTEDTNGNRITAGYTDNRLTSLTDSTGDKVTYSYNAQGRISQIEDPVHRLTQFNYDGSGEHLMSVMDPTGTTSYEYVSGQGPAREHALKSIAFPDGTHLFFEYDDQGRLVRQSGDSGAEAVTFAYDTAGGVTVTDAAGGKTTFLRNEFEQVAQVQDTFGHISRFSFDATHQLTHGTGPGGITSTLRYDGRGNPSTTVDPLGHRLDLSYELKFNSLHSLRDARGNTTGYDTDPNGNLRAITYIDGSKEQFSYDPLGNLIESVNRRGQAIRYHYDAHNLLTRKDFANGSHVDFDYDDHRNLKSAKDDTGTILFEYDSADRLTKVTYPSARFLAFTYDAGGRRSKMVDQSGFTVNYAYDAAGRLSRLTDTAGKLIVSYAYDAVGRLSRKDMGNGTYTTYEYDAASQLLHLVNNKADGSVLSRYDYTYDDQGRHATMTTLDGHWTYDYDATGQLTHAVFTSNNPSAVPNQDLQYVYDAAGNRTRTIINGVTTDYVANSLNEYTTVGTATYKYDADGNLVSKSESTGNTTNSYNDRGQLVSVVSGAETWNYEYDALGNRIAVTHNGQATQYLIDPTGLRDVVAEYDGSANLVAHYTQGLGLTGRVDATGAAAYYNFDVTGNTTELTGATGNTLNSYSYLPFGEIVSGTATTPNPFKFVGQFGVMQESNGLTFMRARYYAPSLGRFNSADPIGIIGGDANYYRYVGNGPVVLIDPIGKEADYPSWGDEGGGGSTTRTPAPPPEASRPNVTLNNLRSLNALPENSFLKSPSGSDLIQTGIQFGIQVFAENYGIDPNNVLLNTTFNALGEEFPVPTLIFLGGTATGSLIRDIPGVDDRVRYAAYYYLEKWRHRFHPDDWFLSDAVKIRLQKTFITSKTSRTPQVRPIDPNDITGPAGFGANGFILPDKTLPYTIHFENQADATAPAQAVVVTQQLDPNLDVRTFQVGDFSIGNLTFHVPDNQGFYSTRLDLRATLGLLIEVTAGINVNTGVATWTFTSLDPTTLDLPADPLAGFLAPNKTAPQGEAFVTYTVRPKASDLTGTRINAQASVVFDISAPVDTPQVFNTIDAGPPNSSVKPLLAASPSSFTVSWSGQDDAGGSGVATYNVYVSDNSGNFTPLFPTGTTQTSATFNGQVGHTYSFYSTAIDNVGNQEPTPNIPQATTTVTATPTPVITWPNPGDITYGTPLSSTQLDATANVPGTFSYSPAAGTVLHAGQAATLTVTFTPTDTKYSPVPASVTINVKPAPLTATFTVDNKVYDGTTQATMHLGALPVMVGPGVTGTFASKNVGNGIAVTVSGLTLVGPNAGDYTLTVSPGSANITPAPLTLMGITANDKMYDGTITATLNTSHAALVGVISGDVVTIATAGATGTFASKDVGNGKTVTVSGISISGADAGNYTLTSTTASTTANITAFIIGDQTLSYRQSTFSVPLPQGDSDSITIAGSMAFFLRRDFGLTLSANGLFQNFAAMNEKWLQGNGNAFGNPWYFIKANGQLLAWDGTPAALGSKLLGTLDPVYYTYPDLLYNATQGMLDLVLRQRLGLTLAGDLFQNYGGQNEKWLRGNLNQYGNPWYFIDSTGRFYAWNGVPNEANGTLLAALDTLYWAQPQRLFDAQPSEVIAGIVNNVLQINTVTSWAGRVVAELDSTARVAQSFALTFVNHAPVLTVTPSGDQRTQPGQPLVLTLGATDADPGDPLTFAAVGGHLGYVLGQTLGLRLQDFSYFNYGGLNEKWLQSTLNHWYFIKPNGSLYLWDGKLNQAIGTLVSSLDPIYYYHPDLLYNAPAGDLAYALDQRLNLMGTSADFFESFGGLNEKWVLGNDGWYFITTDGKLWKWNGTLTQATATLSNGSTDPVTGTLAPDAANATLMATLDPDYYTNIQRLVSAQPNQVAISVVGNTLTLAPAAGFIGDFWYVVTVSGPSQSVSAPPAHLLSHPTSITFWERTGGPHPDPYTFAANSQQLTTQLTGLLGPTNADFVTAAHEYYDVFYSDINGTFNAQGDFLTVEARFDYALPFGGGLNIAEIDVNPSDGTQTEHGLFVNDNNFIALGDNKDLTSVNNAADGNLFSHTTMGNTIGTSQRLRITVGFNRTTVTASAAASTYGQAVTFTASIQARVSTPRDPVSPPTGSVEFFDDTTGADLGAGTRQGGSNDTATWTYTTRPTQLQVTAADAIRAVYRPADGILGSSGTTTVNITPAPLTVTGITASNKVYDATTTATLNVGSAALVGVAAGDTVTLNTTGAAGTFASKDVANGIAVTVSGLTLGGAQARNYTLIQPTTAANIRPKTLTVTGVAANNKVYDSTTTATLNTGSAALVGVRPGDTVTLNAAGATGTFASKDAANGIAVTVAGLTLAGAQAADYTVTQPATTANITPKTLSASIIGTPTKTYDGTTAVMLTSANFSFSGLVGTETFTVNQTVGTFNSKDVATATTVTVSLAAGNFVAGSGTLAADYTLPISASGAGAIAPKPLTVTGITADTLFDPANPNNTAATVNTTNALLVGLVIGDTVTLNTSAAKATFPSPLVGTYVVTITGLTISGPQAGDYVLTPPTVTASITNRIP